MNYRERDRLRKEWAGRSKVVQTLEQAYRRACARANDAGLAALATDTCLALAALDANEVPTIAAGALLDPVPCRAPGVAQIIDGDELARFTRNACGPLRTEPARGPDGLGVRRILAARPEGAVMEGCEEVVEWSTLTHAMFAGEPWLLREEPRGPKGKWAVPVLVLYARTGAGCNFKAARMEDGVARAQSAWEDLSELVERTTAVLEGHTVGSLEVAVCAEGPRIARCSAPDAVAALATTHGPAAVQEVLVATRGTKGVSVRAATRAIAKRTGREAAPWPEGGWARALARALAEAHKENGQGVAALLANVRRAGSGGTAEQRAYAGRWRLAMGEVHAFGAWRPERTQERCLDTVPGTARFVGRSAWARVAPLLVEKGWGGMRWEGLARRLTAHAGLPLASEGMEWAAPLPGWEGWETTVVLHVFTTPPKARMIEPGTHIGTVPVDHAVQIALAAMVLTRRECTVVCGLQRHEGTVTRAVDVGSEESVVGLAGRTVPAWSEVKALARRAWEVLSRGYAHQRMEIVLAKDGPRVAEIDPTGTPALAQWANGRGLANGEALRTMGWWVQRKAQK